jgi:hypothetical protein
MQITVVNRSKPSSTNTRRINVMREGHGGNGLLGNPEWLPRGSSLEARAANIERYRAWLRKQFKAHGSVHAELQRLLEIATMEPLELECCCAPLQCHADVVREALLGMAKLQDLI